MLLYISITSCILALVFLFYNWNTNKNSLYLFLLIIIISIHGILHASIIAKGPITVIMILFNSFSPLYFLPGPLLFWYVRGTLTDQSKLHRKDLLHFIPAIIVLINVAPYWFTSADYKYNVVENILTSNNPMKSFNTNWLLSSNVNFTLRCSLMLAYQIKSGYMVYQFHPFRKGPQQIIIYRFLNILVYSMLLLTLGYISVAISYYFSGTINYEKSNAFVTGFDYIGILAFLVIPFSLLVFPQILYGLPIPYHRNYLSGEDVFSLPEKPMIKTIDSEESVNDKSLQPFQDLAQFIEAYLEEHKPYLERDFSIDSLARAMNVPRHHLYYCMNRVMNIKFPEMRRKLRIEYAKKLLEQGNHKNLSMEGIGTLSGFSSRSNFFTVFKEEVGLTPSEYIEKSKLSGTKLSA